MKSLQNNIIKKVKVSQKCFLTEIYLLSFIIIFLIIKNIYFLKILVSLQQYSWQFLSLVNMDASRSYVASFQNGLILESEIWTWVSCQIPNLSLAVGHPKQRD